MEKNNKTYEEFTLAVSEELTSLMNARYGIDVTTQISPVIKTNGEQIGIIVHYDDSNIATTVYPEKAYKQYQENGITIEKIADEMSKVVYEAHTNNPEIPEFNLNEAKKSITLTLVNTERNEKMLEKTPHYEIGDLSVIPRWYISEDASFVVDNDMAAKLMLTPDEILQIGQENLNKEHFEIKTIQDMMKDIFEGEGMDPELIDAMIPDGAVPQMIVMTSENHIQGSKAIISEDALKQVYDMLQGDYIILPSSIHEVICVPDIDNINPDDLKDMVREINMTQVAPDEFLSDNIMRYDGQKLTMVTDDITIDVPEIDELDMELYSMKM